MKEFDVKVTVDIGAVPAIRPLRTLARVLLNMCTKRLQKYMGEKPVMPVSQPLQLFGGNTTRLWSVIDIVHTLQSLGIIQYFSKNKSYPDEPRVFGYSTSEGGGRDFLSEENAAWKAIAESIERYIWRRYDFFSNLFGWIPAHSLISNKKMLCPIQFVSSLYFRKNVKTPWNKEAVEPMLRWCITTGLASGRTLEEAVVAGILEVVERDAFMITYLNKLSPPLIDIEHLASQDKDIETVLKKFKRYKLDVYLLSLPTDFPVFVTLALVVDHTGKGPAASVGASADFNIKTCILDALSEPLSVRMAKKETWKEPLNLDRIGREGRILYYTKKENAHKLDFLIHGKKINVNLKKDSAPKSTSMRYSKEQLAILVNELRLKNLETCYINLTTKETGRLDIHTAFVIIPELQPMHLDEEIPYFGGKRLKEVPLKLGYTPAKELNKDPHPFP
ncbi:MAG: YcaO-like family protein [Parcubacteria group bacterium]|nr:YcaO-like family protein [Parcubacteria group bacterium]